MEKKTLMELQKYLTSFDKIKTIDEKQKNKLLEEFDFFYINYDLWYKRTIYTEESNPNKTFDYDERLINFLNQQEENLINLVKLKDYNLEGKLYFNFIKFWKDNYYRMASKKLSQNIKELVDDYCK